MISKMISHALILVLAASLCRSHEEMDAPLTQSIGGLPPSAQTPGYPPGLYPGVGTIGGCPGVYPPTQGGMGPYTSGGFPNHPLNGGGDIVIVPGNPQYQSSYNPQPGVPIYYNGQTFVPNIQYGTNTQHTGGPYYASKTLLEVGLGDKSRAASSNSELPAYGIADEQDKPQNENLLGGLYLAPYRPCDNNSGRSSENEYVAPLQVFDSRTADSPILTAIPLNPHFAHGLNNYFHRFGFTRPLPHGGLIYSNTFSNHLHSNFH